MNNRPQSMPLGPLMADVAGQLLDDEERRFLCHPSVGAVILFSRNFSSPTQVRELVTDIKSLRSPALLVAVDQEGGRVQRFRDGFYRLPPLNSLGLIYQQQPAAALDTTYDAGRLMAVELRATGVDFSFAPVLDIADLDSTIIGDRAFHHDPEIIVKLAERYIAGMNSAGMQATGKHFPGHGGVLADSHLELPQDDRDYDTLAGRDLVPFSRLATQLGGIMTAHVLFPRIDDALPTFSSFWIRQVLRDRLGFNGLVFSDDLIMQGAAGAGSVTRRAQLAMDAGCDMVLVCNDPDAARSVANHIAGRRDESTAKEQLQSRLAAMAGGATSLGDGEAARLASRLSSTGLLV